MDTRVSVAVRIRPVLREGRSAMHQQERYELVACQRVGDHTVQLQEQRLEEACRSSTFTFDHVFDQESTQLEVYEDAIVDLIDGALLGINATILAYGQTGSGKTHTVLGDVKANPLENDLLTANSGMFLRVLADLIDYREKRRGKMHVVIGLSCVEIYNENIRDLFGGSPNDPPPPLKVVMTEEQVYMPNLIVKEVATMNSVFNEIQLAINRRQSRQTESNATSSRSHCLFMIDLLQRDASASLPSVSLLNTNGPPAGGSSSNSGKRSTRSASPTPTQSPAGITPKVGPNDFFGTVMKVPGEDEPVFASKILLADLAGSEKTKASGVTGEGLTEATSINSSLTALGNVVHALHEGAYASYRVSNLTRLLKPAFSHPKSKVLLLAQLSPTQLTYDESISTMHFSNKVKQMRVVTNQGAESDSLAFAFVDTEKIIEPMQAEMRIFTSECESSPVVRKHRVLSKAIKCPRLYVHGNYKKMSTAAAKRDRLNALDGEGALTEAREQASRKMARDAAEKEKEEREKPQKISTACDAILEAYHNSREDLTLQYNEECTKYFNDARQHLTIEASFEAQQIRIAENDAFEAIATKFDPERLQILRSLMERGETERKRLAVVKVPRPSDVGMEEQRALDVYYATSMWCHGNAKRFFDGLMDVREVQLTAYRSRLQNNKVQRWVDEQRIKAEKEKEKQQAAQRGTPSYSAYPTDGTPTNMPTPKVGTPHSSSTPTAPRPSSGRHQGTPSSRGGTPTTVSHRHHDPNR